MKYSDGYKKSINTEEIVHRYCNGETVYSIAKSCEVSQSTIIYRLKQVGVYESKLERKAREEELAGFNCCEEYRKRVADVNAKKVGSLVALASFVIGHCKDCEYASWRCEKAEGSGEV